MDLEYLAAGLTLPEAAGARKITGLTADSRKVQPGFLFAAFKGVSVDGTKFAPDAAAAGAIAILCAEDAAAEVRALVPETVAVVSAVEPRQVFAKMAARFYGAQPDTIVAVTGTAGKTSVAHFARQIFQAAGHPAASLGTLGLIKPDGESYGGLTTPDPVALHKQLAELEDEGVNHAALEASSHGLDQYRLDGVRLTAAAFTNLGRDHMDYHPTIEHYLNAKLRLFAELLPAGGTVVLDPGEKYADRVMAVAQERGLPVFTVGETGRNLTLTGLRPVGAGQELTIQSVRGEYKVTLPLIGRFQVSNALIAAGLAISAGIDTGTALRALENLKGAPGRLELAGRTPAGGLIFVDYAHKPDALDNALVALKPFARGKLSVVIGAGGDRDPGKRELMGEVAARRADLVIVTDDNPRSEDPAAIRKAVMSGAPGAIEIGDRYEAIAEGVRRLKDGDILCVAGKGHETGQIVGDTVIPFSDHEAVKRAISLEGNT
ncbi:UDP-N-acetylmuramoylalanyl-D-glutamate--2,6-diaminopimelate ligase [Stappia aggregata IAM 12614]|uniref:UDP-N-acetylmuramoyl-L-alanyl-D-glutamate--2,6-diaminopimelate ligase n=1 Tax=Roseibium aggregatum (strain ATCC 25650 / DSM 13394 / JCM 20685 / NBRC 16684 / NCIMB 2208 / IAM 12614 / B1) TaxID=384765 RepID=A0NVP5_ROSAI|nr:UDP-N-acetylmuramoyl-L-alanyl-D-glutamate--2,6-diaminopimelate ligase [Roseibium aggregatum]EAV43060.1 UDP-N-acetylmuramoylalanyl-D-glutamate--2,6-diaminopimelate ligase [Stappia aggregata IAM 12614] [Roseibium aggregatum IAM 12614]